MDSNFDFFRDNLQNLVEQYAGKYIVIQNKSVIMAYDTFDEAYVETIETEELGSFIIQLCTLDALTPSANFAWNNITFSTVAL